MFLSDVSVKRPVLATVASLLLVAFGIISFERLPLRQYPDIDPPVVSVETVYPGASASVVETRITKLIEDRISGIEGIAFIESSSQDGQSQVNVEFNTGRDVDAAANDIRDRVSGILDDLPEEADPPEISKVDSNQDVILWLNLAGEDYTVPELTDFAERYLVDRFSILDGVARVRVGGSQSYAMRVWLDRKAMAARGLTTADIESALRSGNVELPAGSIESREVQFTVRLQRAFFDAEDFADLVVKRGEGGYLVRLKDVARVERGTVESRSFFRGNTVPMVGIGIVKQSTANTIQVAELAQAEAERLNPTLPEGLQIRQSYDTSVFIKSAISEVYKTLLIAIGCVIFVILLFLGNVRAMLVPAVTVPVSIVATFSVLFALGFTINLLTLLALVLAIGLVVDDAIVVLENIVRRMKEYDETPLVAAYRGARQVGFAVVATTLVLISVFVPVAFVEGDIGRLFTEFAITMAAAVGFSSFVALTLSPMIASKVLSRGEQASLAARAVDGAFSGIRWLYRIALRGALKARYLVLLLFAVAVGGSGWLLTQVPQEYAPREDRGAFFILVNGPEGASYAFTKEYMDEVERRLMPFVENGEFQRLLVRAPRSFGNAEAFNDGIVIVVLSDWAERRSAWEIMNEVNANLADLPGVRAFSIMRQGLGGGLNKPVQFTIGGGTWEQLVDWRDTLLAALEKENPGLVGVDYDYKETQPQVRARINYDLAAELGVTVRSIGTTLQTMFGSRRVTTYLDDGEEYDVILEGERTLQRTPSSLQNVYVRSQTTQKLIPLTNFIELREEAGSRSLARYNRVRAITIEANLADGLSLGQALTHLEKLARDNLPESVVIDYKGQSLDYKSAGQSILFVFVLGAVIVFLVLAAQFESFVHPFVIMLTVPLAIGGGLAGLWLMGETLNIYSQIGLIMLVGLAAKNGILIVEFANQLRDGGQEFDTALFEAAQVRLRPILMTGITTAAGALPLILSFGAGAETRFVIGTVVIFGVIAATFLTLFVVPVAYSLLARGTSSPEAVARQLERERTAGSPAE
jgi:multidrug efflux pump